MAETSCNPPEGLHEDHAPPPLESVIIASSVTVEETSTSTERGKGKQHGRKKRADHKMLPPEILETYN